MSLSLLFFGAISDSGTTRRWLRGRSETDAAAGSVSSMASCLRLWSACRVAMAVESQADLINGVRKMTKTRTKCSTDRFLGPKGSQNVAVLTPKWEPRHHGA